MSTETATPTASTAPAPSATPPAVPSAPKSLTTVPPTAPRRATSDMNMKENLAKMFRAAQAGNADPQSALNAPAPDAAKIPDPVAPVAKAPEAVTPPAPEAKTKTSIFDAVKPKETPAAPPPEVKAGEEIAGPEDAIALPADASEQKKSDFAKMKEITKQLRRDLAAREKTATTLTQASPEEQKKQQELQSQLKVMSDRLAVLDIQNHPDFKRQFVKPREDALNEVKEILSYTSGKEGVTPEVLAGLLEKPLKDFSAAVAELTKDMNGMDAATVQHAMRNAYKLQADGQRQMASASELAQQLNARSSLQQKEAFNEISTKLGPMGDVLVKIDVPQGASPEESAEIQRYNQSVEAVRSRAEQNAFSDLTPKHAAKMAYSDAIVDHLVTHGIPRMEKEYRQLLASHNQMAQELEAIRKNRSPSAPVGDPASSTAPAASKHRAGSPEAIMEMVRQSGSFR